MAKSKQKSTTKKPAKPRATARGNAKSKSTKAAAKPAKSKSGHSEVIRVGAAGHRDVNKLLKYVQKHGWDDVAEAKFPRETRPTMGLVVHQAVRVAYARVTGKIDDDADHDVAAPDALTAASILPDAGPCVVENCGHDAELHVYKDPDDSVASCTEDDCACAGYKTADVNDVAEAIEEEIAAEVAAALGDEVDDSTVADGDGDAENHTEDASDDPATPVMDFSEADNAPIEDDLADLADAVETAGEDATIGGDETDDSAVTDPAAAPIDPAAPVFSLGSLAAASGR